MRLSLIAADARRFSIINVLVVARFFQLTRARAALTATFQGSSVQARDCTPTHMKAPAPARTSRRRKKALDRAPMSESDLACQIARTLTSADRKQTLASGLQ